MLVVSVVLVFVVCCSIVAQSVLFVVCLLRVVVAWRWVVSVMVGLRFGLY